MNHSFASGGCLRHAKAGGSAKPDCVLAAAEGQSDNGIAQRLETNRKTVTLWRLRFEREGLDCLWEVAPGRGRKPTYGSEKIEAIVDATLRSKPVGMTHWSCLLMAAGQGVASGD